jgi:hypothetical protein
MGVKFLRVKFERVNFVDCIFDNVVMERCEFRDGSVNLASDRIALHDCVFFEPTHPRTAPVLSGREMVSPKLTRPVGQRDRWEFYDEDEW